MSATFTRAWIGLGLAAGLFLGCQQFLGQEEKAPAPTGGATSDPPADMALKLTLKETDACLALRDQVISADAAGAATVDLQTEFIRNCIEGMKPVDPTGRMVIPADLLPVDTTHCRWLVSGIDAGHGELVIKFRHYCPDSCDTLNAGDSVHHAGICRDPVPECAEIKARLAYMDPKSEDHARLRLYLAEHCGIRDTLHPPKDTLLPPKDTVVSHTPCDSLRHAMGTLDPASAEYARLKQLFYERCVVKPPVDTLHPVPTHCDSLKHRLASLDPASTEYAHILALLKEGCSRPDTVVVKPPVTTPAAPLLRCDSLRLTLSRLDPSTHEYGEAKMIWYQECIEPKPINDTVICGHLMSRLKAMDTTAPEYPFLKHEAFHRCPAWFPAEPVKPVDPVPVSPECADIKKRMSQDGLPHEEYTRLKTLYSEKCLH